MVCASFDLGIQDEHKILLDVPVLLYLRYTAITVLAVRNDSLLPLLHTFFMGLIEYPEPNIDA